MIQLIAAALLLAPATALPQDLPPDQDYVTVKNGQLVTQGKRIRLWCVIGGFPNPSGIEPGDDAPSRTAKRDRAYRDADAILDRFIGLGFNGIRFWERDPSPYVKGDGSKADVIDYFVAGAKKRGMRIWLPSVSTAPIREDDAALVQDSATEPAWREAIRKGEGPLHIARVWDPRLEAAQVEHMRRLTGHVNQHTGRRWGDDPVFAIWELTNEEWWMGKMVGGTWKQLPAFFQASLSAKWHAYLKGKYGSQDRLVQAWSFLLPGEDMQKGSIQIAPLASPVQRDLSGMDPQARAQIEESMKGSKSSFGRDDFTRARGADVLEFLIGIQLAHKDRLKQALKGMGKSARLGPVAYDTGIGYEIQSQYLHQHAEAVVHDAYINGFTDNKLNPRYPWYSGLEEWPRIAQDVPWLEHNRVEGKPYLCYETQIMQPGKYRAEFPMRILALAAIQDWDAICWHYWGNVPHITTKPKPFDQPMDNTVGWHPQGYHYTYDAVQNAVMRAAAMAFRQGALKPAPRPTIFLYGRKSLYDPASMDYAGSYGDLGLRMLPTTYAYGVRIWIDPSLENDSAEGPTVNPLAHTLPNRLQPTPEITFDIGKGGLTFDSPFAVGFTGFFSNFSQPMKFGNGVALDQVKVTVPPAMPHAEGLEKERYLAFMLASEDGLPLARAKRAVLALKSTSFNSGFKLLFQPDKLAEGGTLPVLEARVSATLRAPALAGMTARFFDWHFEVLRTVKIGPQGVLELPEGLPYWVVELQR